MKYIHRDQNNLRLISRNEGKIKSYGSCTDARAWSHDIIQRDTFLKEWIKTSSPISVIPVHVLSKFLRAMTRRSQSRALPKCHPDCKSKVVLESICASCHVMKECFNNDTQFHKYFAEEEFETCNWPCERCLEVLKSIRMFWKIIIEKIFRINISSEDLQTSEILPTGNIQSVAKGWERKIMQQALFVKNTQQKSKIDINSIISHNNKDINERKSSLRKVCQLNKGNNTTRSRTTTGTNTMRLCPCTHRRSDNASPKKVSKCTLVKVKTEDVACDTCSLKTENDELKAYKNNIEYLQEKLVSEEIEKESMKKENKSLRLELENFYKSFTVKAISYAPMKSAAYDDADTVVPFENCIDNSKTEDVVDNIESEMIITLKNCRNKGYKYVSLLKVLHKTNVPINDNDQTTKLHCSQENPMDILTKVQNTFGALVKREMGIASKTDSSKRLDISATFHKVNSTKSVPSCCTITTDDVSCGSKI